MSTHVLKTGDSLEVNGRVTVTKCGMHSAGGAPPVPTVMLEVDGDETSDESQESSDESQESGDESLGSSDLSQTTNDETPSQEDTPPTL